MRETLKNTTRLLIYILVIFLFSCTTPVERKNFQERVDGINTKMQETLLQVEQLKNERDVSKFSSKTKELLDSIDNQIEVFHHIMDETNQKIDKNARNLIISFKQKKVELEFKLNLLNNGGAYIQDKVNLSHSDTMLTSRNASGSAVTHKIEPLEQDETRVETKDPALSSAYRAINDWEYNDTYLREELLNDLEQVKETVDQFRKENL